MQWTVARYTNGTWDSGGKPSDYQSSAEVFVVEAADRDKAVIEAKKERQRKLNRRYREIVQDPVDKIDP